MKRLALLGCGLALSGCAALLNAGRPAYNGPVLTPLWHVADLEVVDTPLIGDGRVYTAARAGQSQPPRAYAFDAQTGGRLWVSSAPASGLLALAGGTVLAADVRGTAHAVDARDGRTIPAFAPRPVAFAVAQDDAFYLTNGAQLAALRSMGQTRWTHALPIERAVPVVAGETVYAFGRHHVDEMTPDLIGVYAFATQSGAARWKREWRQSFGKYRYDPKLRAMTWKVKPDYTTIAAVVADDRTAYVFEQLRDERLLATAQRIVAVDARTGT
ncbi:MAG TPA: PQQ-binding-like beta-propeller repeat protein, partial [Candidatus Tumulicola sp.]|nr:PQQ-binding-like beta-propeller repeat protein [Candidatus Tumulicola sp.]